MIAHDEQRAHRLALAAFAANVDGQVDDRLQRLQRNARLELAQVANRQLAQVLAQPDDAQRIDDRRLEPAVHGHDRRPGRQQLVGHRFQQRLRQPLVDGRFGRHVEQDRVEVFFGRAFQRFRRVAGQEHRVLARRLPQAGPNRSAAPSRNSIASAS